MCPPAGEQARSPVSQYDYVQLRSVGFKGRIMQTADEREAGTGTDIDPSQAIT